MAILGANNLTLADISRRLDPNGKVAKIVEILNNTHEVLDGLVLKEANDGTRHKTTTRTGIPQGTWRKLYGGIQSSKSSTAQVIDTCGMLEALANVDVDLVDKSSDKTGVLLSESKAYLEGLRQQVESTLIYGDTDTNPERFLGFTQRYNTLSVGDDSISSYNVLNGGGVGSDNTSIWLAGFGDDTCHGVYPQGSMAGLHMENKGKRFIDADDGSGEFEVYTTKYKWDIGLTVRDWRSVGRIANIDVSNLEANAGAQANLIRLMIQLQERVQERVGSANWNWIMHPRVRTMLRIQKLENTNTNVTFETVEGKKVLAFDDVPIRASRELLLTEAAIS